MLLEALLAGILYTFPHRDIPPPEYRGDGHASTFFIRDELKVDKLCKNTDPKIRIIGCVFHWPHRLMIIGHPCDYKEERYARHVCHELGHVNGWPRDHPNREVYTPPQTSVQTGPKK